MTKNEDILKNLIKDIGKLKEIYHFAAKDAVLRSHKKASAILARAIKKEFKRIPIETLKRKMVIKKSIPNGDGPYGIKVNMDRVPVRVWDTLSGSVQGHLLATRGAKFKEKENKKGKFKIVRSDSKNLGKKVNSKVNVNIKRNKSLYRTYVFVIHRMGRTRLLRRDGGRMRPVMTSSSSEIMSNTPSQKLFFDGVTDFFIDRFLDRLMYKIKGLMK